MNLSSPDTGPFPFCQVLNMKPAEILGMLEEAAGTRMYENKKEGALRTLDKKQLKVDEIQKVRGAGPAQLLGQLLLLPQAAVLSVMAYLRDPEFVQGRH